jgi:hypothetical protein
VGFISHAQTHASVLEDVCFICHCRQKHPDSPHLSSSPGLIVQCVCAGQATAGGGDYSFFHLCPHKLGVPWPLLSPSSSCVNFCWKNCSYW